MNNNKAILEVIHACGKALTEANLYSKAVKIWQVGIERKDKLSYINLAKIYVTDLCTQNISSMNHTLKVTPESCRALMIDMYQSFPNDTIPFLQLLSDLPNIPPKHREFYKKLLKKTGANK